MEQRVLGKTRIRVSIVGFGAGNIGDASLSEEEAEAILHYVLDLGINLIDTARSYGKSEERIGRYLRANRQQIVLSTKVGYGIPGYRDWTPECIIAGVDYALQQLQTDYIDIVHLHSCPLETLQHSGVVEALARAVETGKVRAAAYSGENEALQWAIDSGQFAVMQTSVNYCDQRVLQSMIPRANDRGIGVIAKRPLANAPWRYASEPETGDTALREYWHRAKSMNIDPGDSSWDELALRFAAYAPGVDTCLVGSTNRDHLKRNIKAVQHGPLPADIVDHIRSVFNAEWRGQI